MWSWTRQSATSAPLYTAGGEYLGRIVTRTWAAFGGAERRTPGGQDCDGRHACLAYGCLGLRGPLGRLRKAFPNESGEADELIETTADKKVMGLAAGVQGSVRKAGALLAAASLAVVVGNEVCQRLVARGLIGNHLLFGYLSDLFAVPFTVGLTNAIGTSRLYWLRPVFFSVLFSLLELEGVRDPWDMACYWFGAVLSYSVMLFVALRRSG